MQMKKEDKMDDGQINELVAMTRGGDNDAWVRLFEDFGVRYVHKRAWDRIKGFGMANVEELEDELYQAGWVGFCSALANYDERKGNFKTYATYYIDGEITKQLGFELNSMGIAGRPKEARVSRVYAESGSDGDMEAFDAMISQAIARDAYGGKPLPEPEKLGEYTSERFVLQMLEVLRLATDEDHSLSFRRLLEILDFYRRAKYGNITSIKDKLKPGKDDLRTFSKSMAELLLELNPGRHTDENDGDYRIKYDGYESDYLQGNVEMQEDNPVKVKKAPVINGLRYVHDFDNASLDRLIQLVSFSDMFSNEEKARLVRRLASTASVYYQTPFMEGGGLKFNPRAIHGRFAKRNGADRGRLAESLKAIQGAINSLAQIRFKFNRYTASHELVPKSPYTHVLSPYHIVVYHDNYYVIGLNEERDKKRVLHYRVDLMTEIEMARDAHGNPVPIKVCAFEGLPISNACWDPEKYMAQHLNMAYDEPRDIMIKIRDTDYTFLHDWFGDHYKKTGSVTGADENGEEARYDSVVIKTSPYMMVHWAMQYGTSVEVLDEEIRGKIREELRNMEKRYDTKQP